MFLNPFIEFPDFTLVFRVLSGSQGNFFAVGKSGSASDFTTGSDIAVEASARFGKVNCSVLLVLDEQPIR
ncbi:hypothetical protein CAL7716_066050 [Calothrix sp. PCC 7716]|nr:hypothetical protein CAL7716_066050 [Calothrix sp. PCC 7716]